jgi:hypothetical protein
MNNNDKHNKHNKHNKHKIYIADTSDSESSEDSYFKSVASISHYKNRERIWSDREEYCEFLMKTKFQRWCDAYHPYLRKLWDVYNDEIVKKYNIGQDATFGDFREFVYDKSSKYISPYTQ